jgi:hypothetical protein
MFAIFAIIIAIIIFILRGFSGEPVAAEPDIAQAIPIMAPYKEIAVIPRAPETQLVAEPLVQTIPITPRKTRAKRNVSFSPRTEIREFNVNGGEIIGQYSKAIGS